MQTINEAFLPSFARIGLALHSPDYPRQETNLNYSNVYNNNYYNNKSMKKNKPEWRYRMTFHLVRVTSRCLTAITDVDMKTLAATVTSNNIKCEYISSTFVIFRFNRLPLSPLLPQPTQRLLLLLLLLVVVLLLLSTFQTFSSRLSSHSHSHSDKTPEPFASPIDLMRCTRNVYRKTQTNRRTTPIKPHQLPEPATRYSFIFIHCKRKLL